MVSLSEKVATGKAKHKKGEHPMSIEENKSFALRMIDEAWSKGNLDVVDELVDADFVFHDPTAGEIHGCEGLKQLIMMYRTGYPDLQFTSEDLIAEGDRVVQRWSCGGTHKAELMGIPATGKQTTTAGINIIRYKDGKAVEEWSYWDTLGWLQQLGVVPQMGGGGD
jgi:steroid delta-isomerase-like uncharacterized protein